jgi:hypothetical protein
VEYFGPRSLHCARSVSALELSLNPEGAVQMKMPPNPRVNSQSAKGKLGLTYSMK